MGKVRAHSGRLHPLERFCSFGPERSHEEWSGSEWGDSKGLGENVDRGVEGWGESRVMPKVLPSPQAPSVFISIASALPS